MPFQLADTDDSGMVAEAAAEAARAGRAAIDRAYRIRRVGERLATGAGESSLLVAEEIRDRVTENYKTTRNVVLGLLFGYVLLKVNSIRKSLRSA